MTLGERESHDAERARTYLDPSSPRVHVPDAREMHLEALIISGKAALALHVGAWHKLPDGRRTRNETPGHERWSLDELINDHAAMHPVTR